MSFMKKIVSCVLVLMLAFSLMVSSMAFKDTENHVNEDAVDILSSLGIVGGYNADTFGPNDTLTRGQICAIMVRALGVSVYKNANNTFVDVPYNHMFRAEIDTAYRHGIMSGIGDGKFDPDGKVTYNQMMTIILNAEGYNANYLPGTWPANVQSIAYANGLTKLVSAPDLSVAISRAEAAQMIVNAFDDKTVAFTNGIFTFTGKTFADALGIISATAPAANGHRVLAYWKNGVLHTTNIVVTTEIPAVYKDGTIAVVGNKEVDFKSAERWYNGEQVKYLIAIQPGDKVTLIYEGETLVAINATKYSTYTPLNIDTSGLDVTKIPGYKAGLSTVTVAGSDIKVSNTVIFGYVVDVYSNNNGTFVVFSDGNVYHDKTMFAGVAENQYMVIFVDYQGAVADYRQF